VQYLKPDFSPDAFEGTADYYSRYRIPYPKVLFKDLVKHITLSPQSRLLDLASGPGRVAIHLAPFFSIVLANDLDMEMSAVGRRDAEKNQVYNIDWLIGRAEELKIEPGSIDLITIGEAFHRLDQSLILDLAQLWLKPGACIAIIGMYSIWQGNEAWHKCVMDIIDKWTPHLFGHINITEFQEYSLLLKDNGFIECSSYPYEFPNYCTVDSVIRYLYSTSRCKKKTLGDNCAAFEAELRNKLLKIDKNGC